ncbi:PREDICTED: CD48 antigen-like, partial [Acanthisitta chloris]|uniref:CD48 antigen-like n=1 Tax=Acanthisitta chloris TaxID=57068 RepID=UPI0004F0E1DD
MEMSTGLRVDLLVLLFVVQGLAEYHSTSKVTGTVGGVVYLSPSVKNPTSYFQIHWRRNNTVRLASRSNGAEAQYPNNLYKGRLELFPNNTLKISSLQMSDSSIYQVYLEDETGKEDIEAISLEVHDTMVDVIMNDPERCRSTLKCCVGLEEVTYEWSRPEKTAILSLQLDALNSSAEICTCKVSSPVSSNNMFVTYRHPCSGS